MNLTDFIAETKHSRLLTAFLKDTGYSAREFLLDMCVVNCVRFCMSSIEGINEMIWNALEASGPGLVTQFKVDQNFATHNSFGIDNTSERHDRSTALPGSHCMVLIGMRKTLVDGVAEYHYLLQNSWKDNYFIECSAAYAESCDAIVEFVQEPSDRYDEAIKLRSDAWKHLLNYEPYAECSLPIPDCSSLERCICCLCCRR